LAVTVKAPERLPAAVGVKLTATMQLAPTSTVAAQLLLWEKSPVAVIEEIVSAAVPLLVSVTAEALPVVPAVWLGKVREPGAKTSVGAVPCPLRLTIAGPAGAFPEMRRLPARLPGADGLKVTAMAQLAPTATEVPQVLVWAKSPVAATLARVRGPVPLLVSVTALAALAVPTNWLAKFTVAEPNEIWETGARPLPPRLAICGEFPALSVTVKMPVRLPVAVGVNAIEMEQLAPLVNVGPQLFVWTKSPVTAIRVMVRITAWLLLSVMVLAALERPTVWLSKVSEASLSDPLPTTRVGKLLNPAAKLMAAQAISQPAMARDLGCKPGKVIVSSLEESELHTASLSALTVGDLSLGWSFLSLRPVLLEFVHHWQLVSCEMGSDQ